MIINYCTNHLDFYEFHNLIHFCHGVLKSSSFNWWYDDEHSKFMCSRDEDDFIGESPYQNITVMYHWFQSGGVYIVVEKGTSVRYL